MEQYPPLYISTRRMPAPANQAPPTRPRHFLKTPVRTVWAALCAMLFLATGAAAENAPVNDPWEGVNRPIFKVNEGLDTIIFKPAAQGYDEIPAPLRDRLANFTGNLDDFVTMMNNILQGDMNEATNDFGRVLINSTAGVLGLFDVAKRVGFEKNTEDFGRTLGAWGMGAGPYVVLPVFGPSSARDAPAKVVDFALHPASYFAPAFRAAVYVVGGLETRADLLDKEDVIKSWSSDYYDAVRNYYLSRRKVQDGGATPEQDYGAEELLEFEEVEEDENLEPPAEIEETEEEIEPEPEPVEDGEGGEPVEDADEVLSSL